MALSDLLSGTNKAFTGLAGSPWAMPLAAALGAWALHSLHPRRSSVLGSGLANLAVSGLMRPFQERQAAQQILLTNPDITNLPPPVGYTGPSVPYGGMNLRRFGPLGVEQPEEFGPGVRGTYLQPTTPLDIRKALGPTPGVDIMRGAVPTPPSIGPLTVSLYTPEQQAIREQLGGLPGGPAGRLAATQALIDYQQQAAERARTAAWNEILVKYQQQHPEMGLTLGVGKTGPTVGLRTLAPGQMVPIIQGGKTVYGQVGPTGITPTETLVGTRPRIGPQLLRGPKPGETIQYPAGTDVSGFANAGAKVETLASGNIAVTGAAKPGLLPLNPVDVDKASKWQLDKAYVLRAERLRQKAAYEGIKKDYELAETQAVLAKPRGEILANPASQIELMDAFIRASQGFDPNLGKRLNLGQVTMLQNAQPGLPALQMWLSARGWLSGGKLTPEGVDNIVAAFKNLYTAADQRVKTIDEEYMRFGRGLKLTDSAVRDLVFGESAGPVTGGGIGSDLSPQEQQQLLNLGQ